MANTSEKVLLLIAFTCLQLDPCLTQVWLEKPSSIERCMTGQNKTLICHYDPQGKTEIGIIWIIDYTSLLTRATGGPDVPGPGYSGKVASSITAQHNAGITLINCQPVDFNGKQVSVGVTFSGGVLESIVNPTLDVRPMSDYSYSYSTNNGENGTFQPGTVITKTAVPLTITITSSTSPPVTMYVVDTSDVTQTPLLPVVCSSLSSGCSLTVTADYVTTEIQLVVDTDASDDSAVRYIKFAPFTPISLPVISSPSPGPISVQAEVPSALNVLCSITGGPAPQVTWTYNGGSLPTGVESVIESDRASGKLTTVNRRLRWTAGSTLEQRRLTGGDYTCTGVVLTETPATVTKTVTVLYGPHSMVLTVTSPLTVVENDPVIVTCNADCSPACSYQWTQGGEPAWSRDTAQLTLYPVNRQDHNNYTCRASTDYSSKNKPLEIIVNFPTTMTSFVASIDAPIQTNNTSLICDISSRPDSTISIKVKATGSVLTTVTGQRAEYTFSSVHCLNTTTYQCTANNDVGVQPAPLEYYLDVMCPVSPANITEKFGRSLGEDLHFSQVLQANPFPAVNRDDWEFSPLNDTLTRTALPDNVKVSLLDTANVVQKQLVLNITNVSRENYGKYGLRPKNNIGQAAQVQLFVVPEGPPTVPSRPQLLHASAVSLLIMWTAGFDGGFTQTFTVLYTNTATGEEYSQTVVTDGVTSTGDDVEHRLKDPDTVLADTEYMIRIQAQNAYQGGSVVIGESSTFRTDAQPQLDGKGNPEVDINREGGTVSVTINLINPDSVSYLVVSVCITGSTECSTEILTDITSNVVVLPLLSTTTKSFTLSVTMFDGDDIVLSHEWIEEISNDADSWPVTWYVIIGVIACLVIENVILAIVCIRKQSMGNRKLKERNPAMNLDCVNVDEDGVINYINNAENTSDLNNFHVVVYEEPGNQETDDYFTTTDGGSVPGHSQNEAYPSPDGQTRETPLSNVLCVVHRNHPQYNSVDGIATTDGSTVPGHSQNEAFPSLDGKTRETAGSNVLCVVHRNHSQYNTADCIATIDGSTVPGHSQNEAYPSLDGQTRETALPKVVCVVHRNHSQYNTVECIATIDGSTVPGHSQNETYTSLDGQTRETPGSNVLCVVHRNHSQYNSADCIATIDGSTVPGHSQNEAYPSFNIRHRDTKTSYI